MEVLFKKISDERHSVEIIREDGSRDGIELKSRSFLRHDFAHFAVEIETPLPLGYWGSVAGGAPLGSDIDTPEIWLAEALAGRVQTLMRENAAVGAYEAVLESVMPDRASHDLAQRIHERVRQLRGHWRGTRYGEQMQIVWSVQTRAR